MIQHVLDRKDPVCLFHSLTGRQQVTAAGLMGYLNYRAILNIILYACRVGQCDGMAAFGLEDAVFGGMNTNHKMGEDQVVCVLHS